MKNFKITQSITDRNSEALKIYFRDISKQPMVDINEEIELAQRIKQGDKKAFDKLINANLRFVVSVAKQYQNNGIPLVDLIQAGNRGLIESASKWDETRGFKFISYAVWWIRQAIIQAISTECRTVRIPMNQIMYMNKITKGTNKLEQEHKRKPSIEELEVETGLSTNKILFNINSVNKTLSLDSSIKEDTCLLDVIPNDNSPEADNFLNQEAISNTVEKMLSVLSNRERDVLKMIFGIGMISMTYEEIGSRFGIGSERVRQIQNEAISKIRKKFKGNDFRNI